MDIIGMILGMTLTITLTVIIPLFSGLSINNEE